MADRPLAPVIDLEERRWAALESAPPLACVQGEARPGLVVIHVPAGWSQVELTPAKARIWLDHLTTLIESAEQLQRDAEWLAGKGGPDAG
jgi:hypothetical protein